MSCHFSLSVARENGYFLSPCSERFPWAHSSASPKNSSACVDITSIFANKHFIRGKNHTKDFREATFDRALKQTGNKFAEPSAKRKALSLEALPLLCSHNTGTVYSKLSEINPTVGNTPTHFTSNFIHRFELFSAICNIFYVMCLL